MNDNEIYDFLIFSCKLLMVKIEEVGKFYKDLGQAGQFFSDKNLIQLKKDVPLEKKIFNLAHEIGHYQINNVLGLKYEGLKDECSADAFASVIIGLLRNSEGTRCSENGTSSLIRPFLKLIEERKADYIKWQAAEQAALKELMDNERSINYGAMG